jgi:hypothetical protein
MGLDHGEQTLMKQLWAMMREHVQCVQLGKGLLAGLKRDTDA